MTLRRLPELLAIAGLAIPLIGSGFALWPFVAGWLVVLGVAWGYGRALLPEARTTRIAIAAGLLAVVVVLAWEGGWWLIPADLAWLAAEIVDRRTVRTA